MLVLKNLRLMRGSKIVLDQANLTVHPGERVGLVGRNGCGKSSLFSLLAGRLLADGGDVEMPPAWLRPGGMAEVAQDMPETSQAAVDFVQAGDLRLAAARQALERAERAGDGVALAQAHADLADVGHFDAPARAQILLRGLGFTTPQMDWPVNQFSGGWRMRLQLARALMCPSELLLLDEPTNHLDLDALVWLESWLQRYSGTLLLISHDRDFLDAVTQVTVHLDQARLQRYSGGYSQFELMRAEQARQLQAAHARQQERAAHLKQFIARFKAKASKAKQAQSRVKALERMEQLDALIEEREFHFEFQTPEQLPNPMMVMRQLQCGYRTESSERIILRSLNIEVLPGQRVGILGANGQGKSTLIKTLAEDLRPLEGEVTKARGLNIGYFAQQELDVLRPLEHPLAHMIRLANKTAGGAREQELRDYLGRFQFGADMALRPVGEFSGGEKARLVLAMIVWQRPHLLLLDEPTNHLDLDTREALGMALNEFEGSVMLVSHDRALLRAVCDEFWLVAGGQVQPFEGDLQDYQNWLQEQARQATARANPDQASRKEERRLAAQTRQQAQDQLKPLQKSLKQIERELDVAQNLHAEIILTLGGLPTAEQRADLGRQLKLVETQIEDLESRWLELGERIQELERVLPS